MRFNKTTACAAASERHAAVAIEHARANATSKFASELLMLSNDILNAQLMPSSSLSLLPSRLNKSPSSLQSPSESKAFGGGRCGGEA
jgi:hypothetical protein